MLPYFASLSADLFSQKNATEMENRCTGKQVGDTDLSEEKITLNAVSFAWVWPLVLG